MSKVIFKFIYAIPVFLISQIAMASENTSSFNEWIEISSSPEGHVYILPSSIAEDELGNRLVWLKALNVDMGDDVKTLKTLYVFDCRAKQSGISHFIATDKDDNIINEQNMPSTLAMMYTHDPDSLSYEIMQLICN